MVKWGWGLSHQNGRLLKKAISQFPGSNGMNHVILNIASFLFFQKPNGGILVRPKGLRKIP